MGKAIQSIEEPLISTTLKLVKTLFTIIYF